MPGQTVKDVLGAPESWPDFSESEARPGRDMSGATISEVTASPDGLAVSTAGGASGDTYSVFRIGDTDLLRRLACVLEIGLDVHTAVAKAI